jgi:hypothetical protein
VQRSLQIDGLGGCDGTKCVSVSNELYVNITRESTPANPPARFAASLPDEPNAFVMVRRALSDLDSGVEIHPPQPLWPAPLWNEKAPAECGDWIVPDLTSARYDVELDKFSRPHDDVRAAYCSNPITLNTTDSVGMNVTIIASPNNATYLHVLTLCLRDLDQNNVWVAALNLSLGRTLARWRRDETGNRLVEVQGFRPLEEGEGIWHASISNVTTELALVWRNTLTWRVTLFCHREPS